MNEEQAARIVSELTRIADGIESVESALEGCRESLEALSGLAVSEGQYMCSDSKQHPHLIGCLAWLADAAIKRS
jgi:hypothetical protein